MTKKKLNWVFLSLIITAFFITSFFHLSLIILYDTSYLVMLTILAFAELILLISFISYIHYKKGSKKILMIFIIVLLLFLFIQIDFIPPKTITVYDVFDKPLEGIPIVLKDNLGEEFCLQTCGDIYRVVGSEEYYLTDETGNVKFKPRIYFGQRKVRHISLAVNMWGAREDAPEVVNFKIDGKVLNINRELSNKVILPRLNIDYSDCNSISDEDKKYECYTYSLFYTAVKDRNPELCKLYGNEKMISVLNQEHRYYFLSHHNEVEYECIIFVKGVLSGEANVCNEIENTEGRHFKDQCVCIFNPDSCEHIYYDEMNLLKPLIGDPVFVQGYLCHGEELKRTGILGSEYQYSMFDIRYLEDVVEFYKQMFCD